MFIDNFYPAPNPIMGNTSSSQVQKCLVSAVGKDMAFKSDPLFQLSHVKPYNLGVPSVPAAVTYPKTTDQIAKIVKCAVENSLKVQPRCGGHSYANYGVYYSL
jgi:FAD/FMN-containing dehydrogenase